MGLAISRSIARRSKATSATSTSISDNIYEAIDHNANILKGACDAINAHADILKKLLEAWNDLGDRFNSCGNAIREATAAQATKPPPIFDEFFNDLLPKPVKRPKRQNFKPKVVKNDQPDETARCGMTTNRMTEHDCKIISPIIRTMTGDEYRSLVGWL